MDRLGCNGLAEMLLFLEDVVDGGVLQRVVVVSGGGQVEGVDCDTLFKRVTTKLVLPGLSEER